MSKITTIEGIGPILAEKLTGANVDSVDELLEKGGTARGRREISAATGLSETLLLRFVNHADLMRIKGVGGEYAELLEAAGVDTVPELAQRNPTNLADKMASVNEAKRLVRQVPSESTVEGWVEQARALDRAVHH